jgi:hypothetical protein
MMEEEEKIVIVNNRKIGKYLKKLAREKKKCLKKNE